MQLVHMVLGPLGAGKSTFSRQLSRRGAQLRRERVMRRNIDKGENYAFEVTGPMFDFMESRFEHPSPQELEQCCNV